MWQIIIYKANNITPDNNNVIISLSNNTNILFANPINNVDVTSNNMIYPQLSIIHIYMRVYF